MAWWRIRSSLAPNSGSSVPLPPETAFSIGAASTSAAAIPSGRARRPAPGSATTISSGWDSNGELERRLLELLLRLPPLRLPLLLLLRELLRLRLLRLRRGWGIAPSFHLRQRVSRLRVGGLHRLQGRERRSQLLRVSLLGRVDYEHGREGIAGGDRVHGA